MAHTLLELADENDGVVVAQPVTHQFLAQLVGATRESVSRSMSQLAHEGLISAARETAVISERRQVGRRGPTAATVEVKRRIIRIEDRAGLELAAGRARPSPGGLAR